MTETQKELAPSKERAAELETENIQLKARLAKFEQKNKESPDFDADALQILRLLAQNDSRLTIQELELVLDLPRTQIQHSVDNLLEHRYLQSYRTQTKAMRYGLSQTGRSFVLKNND